MQIGGMLNVIQRNKNRQDLYTACLYLRIRLLHSEYSVHEILVIQAETPTGYTQT